MKPQQSFKVAIIQHAPVFLNLDESVKLACSLIEEAANQGAKMIAFCETWLPGYPVWLDFSPNAALWDSPPAKALYRLLAENSLTVPGKQLDKLLAVARKTGTYIIMGAHERSGGTLYNTLLYLHKNGKDFQVHRKLVPTYTERLVWGRGDGSTLGILSTEYGNLGGLVCWEHWMPLVRATMHAQHEVVHVSQWPSVKDIHQIASRHYAFEGQCFVLAAGSILSRGDVLEGFRSLALPDQTGIELLEAIPGDNQDLIHQGGSSIIAPNAEYLVGPMFDESGIIYADINPNLITEGHLVLDTDGHYSRPDVFHLEVNDFPQSNVTFSSQHLSQ